MRRSEVEAARARAQEFLERAGIVLTEEEAGAIEVADLGLGEFESTGLCLVTYINTERVCAKELILFPRQTCPQHLHPPVGGEPGKEETFRCRWGEVYLYVEDAEGEGVTLAEAKAKPPKGREHSYLVGGISGGQRWREIVLKPGEQYTIYPETWHWFQGGAEGAVVSEFSTKSRDESDLFTDPEIRRLPVED